MTAPDGAGNGTHAVDIVGPVGVSDLTDCDPGLWILVTL